MTTTDGGSEVDSGGVVAGFFAFTEITEPSAHAAYNEWHQLDHLPEQLPIPGIALGQRWVATPRCRAVSHSSGVGATDLSAAQYLTLYLMRAPLEETLRDFYDLAVRLHEEDRFFPHRRALESGPLAVRGTFPAPRVKISAAAVPYRPNRGVYVVVDSPKSDEPEVGSEGRIASRIAKVDTSQLAGDLLQIAGVAGVWFFGSTGVREPGIAPQGGGTPFEADVTLCFLDDDPVTVAGDITDLLERRSERMAAPPRFAGPFETVIPWSWDWFDEH